MHSFVQPVLESTGMKKLIVSSSAQAWLGTKHHPSQRSDRGVHLLVFSAKTLGFLYRVRLVLLESSLDAVYAYGVEV